jgi:hypothetical protein
VRQTLTGAQLRALVDFRTPRFDLDNLYGRGPDDQPYMYKKDGIRMLLTIINCGSYWRGVRSSLGLARKPSRRPGWYCIRRSRVLTSAVS